jgi:hypothetical protein
MTLKEYLNQKDPIKMPEVVLKKSELIIANTRKDVMGRETSRVYINSDNPLVAGVEYQLKDGHLYTVDGDGNRKILGMSVFRVEDNAKLAKGGYVFKGGQYQYEPSKFVYTIGGL